MLTSTGAWSEVTAWLVGSGAYEGWTYHMLAQDTGTIEVRGIIYPGPPPPAP